MARLLRSGSVQAKLVINEPGDRFEQEADRVARDVMRMPSPNAPPLIQRACKECEDEALSRKEISAALPIQRTCDECDHELESTVNDLFAGGGRPLGPSVRAFFEPRMGHDFGAVRVHTDAQADSLARSIHARAFTHSNHVVFRAGEYAPETSAGRALLAHELTHTIQQGASSAVPGVQRACEVTRPPADLGCTEATSSTGTGTNIFFGLDSPALAAADRSTLSAIAAAWHAGGGVSVLRIDGFASCDGPADLNWRLSCRRAQAVATELEAPSDGSPGVPNTHLEVLANGETDLFSPTLLPPNRRVVITSGGTPPPGPRCGLTISGLDEVDRYCAAYVPSDAAACGVFPAPNITLTAAGGAAGATLRWSITRGAAQASIVGATTGPSATIKGDGASGSQGDVIVQVTDGTCTTTHGLTVREPSAMTAAQTPTSGPTFVQIIILYTVQDQFGNPMGSNICVDETVTVCAATPPSTFRFGDAGTNAAGQVPDTLRHENAAGLPATLCIKLDQILTAGGCGPLLHNTILFRSTGITLTPGASCAPGDPCP